jgi:hypothetical protein
VALLDPLFALIGRLWDRLKAALGPFGKLVDKIIEGFEHVKNILSDGEALFDSIRGEIEAWKNFKEDVRIRQRVIQLESAVARTRALLTGVPEAWHSLLDIWNQLKSALRPAEVDPAELQADVEAIESGEVRSVSSLLDRFPKLLQFGEKLLGVVTVLIDALVKVSSVIADLQQIVDELKAWRLEIERLDTIFLQQSNKRKNLKLADGRTIRIRVGKLHSSV